MLRTSIFLLLFVFASSFVLIAFFLPSFFFAEYKYKTIGDQAQSVNLTNADKYENSSSIVKKINGMANALSYGKSESALTTDLIDKIISLKNSNITISAISISSNAGANVKNIVINGTSGNRDDLTVFYNNLKGEGSFQNVILPVSSLIQSTGASFTITLSYKIN